MSGKIAVPAFRDIVATPTDGSDSPGPAERIVLRADHVHLVADGMDVVIVSASLVDRHGAIVPIASDEIELHLVGTGTLLGARSRRSRGDGARAPNRVFNSVCMTIPQAARTGATLRVEATSGQLPPAEIEIERQSLVSK